MNWKINSDVNGEGISPDRRTTRTVPASTASSKDRKSRQVEVVVQALAHGLEHDREIGELPRDLQQVFGAEPLEPERRSLGRIGAGHEQRAGGVLAEAQAEEGRFGQLFADQPLRQLAGQAIQQVQRRLAHRRQPEE